MKRLFGAAKADIEAEARALRIEAERARVLVEESMEIVIVLDSELNVLAASRRAREAIDGLLDGQPVPTAGPQGIAGVPAGPGAVRG